nr:MAG TPA: hypothetical protein [Caudoviricetes sp.]
MGVSIDTAVRHTWDRHRRTKRSDNSGTAFCAAAWLRSIWPIRPRPDAALLSVTLTPTAKGSRRTGFRGKPRVRARSAHGAHRASASRW